MNDQIFRELCKADQIVAVCLAIIYVFSLAYMVLVLDLCVRAFVYHGFDDDNNNRRS